MKTARAGMTLIEVVVAIGLASIVMTIGYAGFNAVMWQQERLTHSSHDARAALVRRTLAEWLNGAVLIPGSHSAAFRGVDGQHEGRDVDQIQFTTSATTPAASRNTVVRLYIDEDTATNERGLVVELREYATSKMQRLELEPHAMSLDARFASRLLPQRDWLPSWISSSVLPDRVEIRIDGDSVHPLIKLPFLVTLGEPK
jgi:prepilin-type N-terminal cleavage/methylation domain-containing protein